MSGVVWISWTVSDRTTESSIALWLVALWCVSTLEVRRDVCWASQLLHVYLVLAICREKWSALGPCQELASPWRSLPIAWKQGLLSVRTQAWWLDWIINALTCLTAAAMPRASTSQGSQVTWCLSNLAQKNPARYRDFWYGTHIHLLQCPI